MKDEFTLRCHLGIGDNLKPIYEYHKLTELEFLEVKEKLKCQEFLYEVEKSYELIIQNYIEFEKELFSIVITNVINGENSSSYPSIDNKINRMLLNLLTSTYLFTCKLAETKNDSENISILKNDFKNRSNTVHANSYEYAFMSFLRNRLNHGGTLPKDIISGGMWSSYWVKSEHNDNLIVADKDMRFSILDIKINKKKIRSIIKKKLKSKIRKMIPDEFYLRHCIRIYINEISGIFANIRPEMAVVLKDSREFITNFKELKFHAKNYVEPRIIKISENSIIEDLSAYNYSLESFETMTEFNRAPLHLERYRMPAEYEERPTIYK